ncbi:TIGR00341 family protein [Poseidonibacter parvus]|uniref:TIGR00341 family protein n=1 Tax=Poseidonibacter parvus TaxID=1850254 RepID=A0A1P8KLR8_9BACT|nr:TIGR00341 family protein [Poseidonibacter parvus]APW65468.1 TIGR00341 family protein [Poseidonibacter parvus]
MYKKVYLITQEEDKSNIEDIVANIKEKYNSEILEIQANQMFDIDDKNKNSLYLLYLDDTNIKQFFKKYLNSNISIGILPNDKCSIAVKNYAISKDLDEAIEDAFNIELLSSIDILKCNEEIAFTRISIGDMHGMNRLDYNKNTRIDKIKIFLKNLKEISFRSYTLTTSKDHSIQTAASGITVLEHTSAISEDSAIRDELSIHDGKLNAYILAPTSLISYIWYLISIFFYQKISLISLPKSLGFIKTTKLTVTSDKDLGYKIDNMDFYEARTIELEVVQDCINIHLGRPLLDIVKKDEKQLEEKDEIKINSLPKAELSSILIGGKLPLFKKASDDEFKDLLVSLKDSASFSYTYLTLMILSTLLATTGLFANSSPVIIGAMILAPLMAPIISLSMGVARADEYLLIKSAKTLVIGIFMALLFSSIYTLFIPLEQITSEMQGRLNPNLLDLMVAIFSGIAGAYATSKEEVAKSLAGVAIAVALVPPLSVTGIGLGLGNIDVILGSFLLFITNLVGITLSATLTFMVLGYAPIKRAKKGIFYTSILMALITVPLFISFMQVVEKNDYMSKLNSIKTLEFNDKKIELNIKSLENKSTAIFLDIEVVSSKHLDLVNYNFIKQKLEEQVDKKIVLKIIPIIKIH